MYKVVDLFAGAGGLSLGFAQTKKYDIKVAFENNPHMQKTYSLNHPKVEVLGDVCRADYAEIQRKYGTIDVVIGGPPCQGFSNANRQKNHAISKNNMLVKQYIRAIVELQPKAFLMENVSMLQSEVHKFYLEENDVPYVEEYQLPVKESSLHLLDEVLMFDGVLDIVQNKERIKENLWPEQNYNELNVIYKITKNVEKLKKALEKHKIKLLKISGQFSEEKQEDHIYCAGQKAFKAIKNYYEGIVPVEKLNELIEPAIMLQRMLSKANEIFENKIIVDRYEVNRGLTAIIHSVGVYDYLSSILGSEKNGYVIDSKILCAADYGAPQKRMRFIAIGIKKAISNEIEWAEESFDEKQYRNVREAIEDIEDVDAVTELQNDIGAKLKKKDALSDLAKILRDAEELKNHIVTKSTDTALERFKVLKQGQNFHALEEGMKKNTYTDISRTQNTIYLRLNYDEPSGTVVNVRKSMWIHPTLDRAISVREAARLQTFPDSFVFCGTKDQQYQQVGNAVPPIMAKEIAKKLAGILDKSLGN